MSAFLKFDEIKIGKMANAKEFSTPEDYFGRYYPEMTNSQEIQKAFTFDGAPASAGDTSLAGTAHGNYRNYIYGKQLWAQMNIRPTVFTAIPRNQYVKSAFRIVTDFATPAIVPNVIKESSSHIPDTKNPKIDSLRVEPRMTVNEPYSMTLAQQALDGLDDTVNFEAILELLQNEFSMRVNGQMLMRNYNAGYDPSDAATNALVNYSYFKDNEAVLPDPLGVPIASLDNLISGHNEYAYLIGAGADADQAKAAVSLFNMPRWAAGVNENLDAHVSLGDNVLRNLSVDLLDDAVQAVMPYWKDNTVEGKVIVTGFDTVGRLQQLHYQYQRFIGYTNYDITYNGIKTCPGDVVGFGVSQFKGIPIVPDLMTTREFSGANPTGLSRMYVLDTNTIHHAVLIPPTFIQDKTYLARRALVDVATYYMSSEMVCTKPRANAKIMLLK